MQRWEAARQHALTWMLVPSLVCWAIWLANGWSQGEGFEPGFAWPAFVTLWTGLRLVRVLTHRGGDRARGAPAAGEAQAQGAGRLTHASSHPGGRCLRASLDTTSA